MSLYARECGVVFVCARARERERGGERISNTSTQKERQMKERGGRENKKEQKENFATN